MRIRSYSLAVALQTLVLVVVSWGAGQVGLLTSVNGWTYDLLLKLTPTAHPSEQTLLIEVSRADNTAAYWQRLFDQLHRFPTRQWVVAYPSEHTPVQAQVIYGAIAPTSSSEVIKGLNSLPKPSQGVYRGFESSDFDSEATLLPVLITQQVTGQGLSTQRFWLDYRLADTGIPRISAQALLEGRISPELLKDKIVFIGLSRDYTQPMLYTSLFAEGRPLTPTEFQLVATQTLLNGDAIHTLSAAWQLGLLFAWCGLCLLAYRNTLEYELWLSLGFAFGAVAVSWLSLQLVALWLPLAELVVTQFMAFFLVYRIRQVQERTAIDQFLFNYRAMMRKHIENASFFDTDQHWSQLINMVNQTLNMNRLIFLERVENDHRVKEIAALNCSISDIAEMRRDYERTPYSTALQLNQPLLLEKTYLNDQPLDEVQMLVPLTFAGEIMGFWAFGIQQENMNNIPNFVRIVDDYGKQIAELLFQRKQWQEQKEEDSSVINRYLSFDHTRHRFHVFGQVVASQHRRLNLFESVFEASSNAVMLYDLFGRINLINRAMESLLEQQRLAGFEFTALDMMHKLSALSTARCRLLLQQVVQQQREIKLLVELGDESYELRISALMHTESTQQFDAQEDQPFELQGILFELKAMSGSKERQSNQVRLVKHLFHLIQNDLESIFLASTLLGGCESDQEREEIEGILSDRRQNLNSVLGKSWYYLQQHEQYQSADSLYPLDTCDSIEKIIRQYSCVALTQKNLRIQTQLIDYSELGMADPAALPTVIHNIIDILAEDAIQNSVIKVRFKEHEKGLIYQFSNQGFGLPEERLLQLLQDQTPQNSENFSEFRYSISQVKEWGGRLSITSQLGRGIRVMLVFKRFS